MTDEVKMCFDLFDKDNSGSISAADAATALRTLGKAPSSEDLEELLNGATSVDLATFQAMHGAAETPDHDTVLEAFGTFDVNNNGYIPLSEFKYFMKTLGEGMSDESIAKMEEACEPDEDKQVNYSHFVKKMFSDL
jgi:Ca2+-binding EF-hand superfamily protein